MTRARITALLIVGIVHQSVALSGLIAADELLGPSQQQLDESRRKAIEFLRTTQAEDGSWTFPQAVGISALVTYGLIQSGVPLDDPMVAKALQNVASYGQEDGRICSEKSQHSGYETSVALMMLKAADESGNYTPVIDKAEAFIRGLQFDEDHGVNQTDDRFGGAGYSQGEGRPDLSNTAFLVEALHTVGASADDPDLQKALIFSVALPESGEPVQYVCGGRQDQ